MTESDTIRFLLFVSLMIFSAHALDVILSSAHGDFKQESEIKTKIINGQKLYNGTFNQLTYQAQLGTTKVIVYIIGRSRFVEIIRNAVRATRLQIAWELMEWNCELVLLGIGNFDDDEYNLISAFMGDKIQRHPLNQKNITIETIGENDFDRFYECRGLKFEKYQGNLLARLRSILHGALRPIESNNKIIKSYDHKRFVREEVWSVTMVNDAYVPDVDVSDPKYNFKMRYPDIDVHLVILSGKEYSAATRYGIRSPQVKAVIQILNAMFEMNYEVLIILGAFNFDWTEIGIVTQFILKHTTGGPISDYYVFTCGFGMFNTIYLNMKNDGRFLMQKPNSNVAEIMMILLREEVKQRSIEVFYSDNGWQHLELSIVLVNGKYVPDGRLNDVSSPCPNHKIAFIVYESTETDNRIDYSGMWQSVENLKQSDISVIVIETTNFGWYDAHIIAEWIDSHTRNVDSEQIAVLGGGIFDTIFQSARTTYNTLFNVKINDLKRIRNACVKRGNEKRVFAAKIDNSPNFEVWSYPMNTINGFYEPDLIPDTKMFNTTNEIFFIITSAHNFHRISAVGNVGSVISAFRQDIKEDYPISEWSVFLVGLDNFEEKDYHLFAELVVMQTNYGCSAQKFVRTFNYGISQAMFQYKDTAPFAREKRPRSLALITTFFESILMTVGA